MTANRVSRRAALTAFSVSVLALPVLLSACGESEPPPTFRPLGWEYLTPLKLNVARVDIDDSWTPRAGTREKGFLAPTPPVDALRKMAEDRLIAGGSSGRAAFVIEDASIAQVRSNYVGRFAVRLDMRTASGTRMGYAEARVSRTRAIRDDSPEGTRAELYDMVRQMMSDMNVEFEFQIRRSLREYLQTTAPAAPGPGPVEQQDLAPPPPPVATPQLVPSPPPLPPAPPRPSAVPFATPNPSPLVR